MGTVTDLNSFRARTMPDAAEAPLIAPITRTPELAIILALLDALPMKTVRAVARKTSQIADRCPDCAVSQEAARIAAIVTVAREGAK